MTVSGSSRATLVTFPHRLSIFVSGFRAAGHAVEIVIIIALIAFIGYRISLYWKQHADRVVPRVEVQILAAKLQTEGQGKILLADVRSHGKVSVARKGTSDCANNPRNPISTSCPATRSVLVLPQIPS